MVMLGGARLLYGPLIGAVNRQLPARDHELDPIDSRMPMESAC